MDESINDKLFAEMADITAWINTVDRAIGADTLTGADLVCLQCVAEELIPLIIEKREELRAAREVSNG